MRRLSSVVAIALATNVMAPSGDVHENDRDLVRPTPGLPAAEMLDAAEVRSDLESFKHIIEDQFSYLTLRNVDYQRTLASIEAAASDPMPKAELQIQLARLVARFGDGHSRVRDLHDILPSDQWLPFAMRRTPGGIVAFDPAARALVDPTCPYLDEIDGMPIEDWIRIGADLEAHGSDALRSWTILERAANAGYIDARRGHGPRRFVSFRLTDHAGTNILEMARPVAKEPSRRRQTEARFETDREGIGYLRVPSFSGDEAANLCADALAQCTDPTSRVKGLIIDVRGNPGGSRDALRVLFPSLMAPGAPPQVVNVARPCASEKFGDDHMDRRCAYRRDDPRWTTNERGALDRFIPTFTPDWEPEAERFGPWHYMVISGQNAPSFAGPVIVLIDEFCFSATDIFVGALETLPQVTLVGRTTGGGSGFSQRVTLPVSGIRLRLSSMASFRPTGERYDTRGIEPDVTIAASPSDVVGRTDQTLDAARAMLLVRFIEDPPGS